MAYFDKNRTDLEIFLDPSTFKTEEQRENDFQNMKIENEKAAAKEKRKLEGLTKPQEPIETITWIGYDGYNDSKLTRNIRDLEPEQKYLERIEGLGGTPNNKPNRIFGDGQPTTEKQTYNNYNEIKIETIPEGITGRKWKQTNKGNE